MKRRLLTVAIFLLAGALVNLAVALSCAFSVDFRTVTIRIQLSELEVQWWREHAPDGFRDDPERVLRPSSSFGIDSLLIHAGTPDRVPMPEIQTGHWIRSGVPLRSLEAEQWTDNFDASRNIPVKPDRVIGGVRFDGMHRGVPWVHVVPLRPILPGFIVNTIFYAGILWLLIPGPFVIRRFLRVKRGLCPKCAYPMGESAVCTECGGALLPGRPLRG